MILNFLLLIAAFHGERVSSTGAWIIPKSFKYHVDRNLTHEIISLMKRNYLKSVIDIGAGTGAYTFALNQSGYTTDAVDGIKNIANLSNGRVRMHDLTTPFVSCKPFDLVLSLEVAEHIPKVFEATYLNNLKCSSDNFLVISWAPPGQFGSGHINLVKASEVKKRIINLGFEYNVNETYRLRAHASLPWFKRNILVFNRLVGAKKLRAN